MRRRHEFEKDMRNKPPSPAPRFSRTFDLLLSQFPDSANITNMASNRNSYQGWRAPVSSPLCAFCNKSVYPAEEVNAAGQKFHKLCLKCTTCNTLLNPGNINEREKKIYCETCYRKQFGPRGVSRSLATCYVSNLETPPSTPSSNRDDDTDLTSTDDSGFGQKVSFSSTSDDDFRQQQQSQATNLTFRTGVKMPTASRPTSTNVTNGTAFKTMSISGNVCPRCSKTVYSAEEVKAAGKSYHKRCYNCAHCKGSLSGGRYSERDGELYDNNCYQRLFGPRGVGFGIGAGALSTGN